MFKRYSYLITALLLLIATFYLCIYQNGEHGKKLASLLIGIFLLVYSSLRFIYEIDKYKCRFSKFLVFSEFAFLLTTSYQLLMKNEQFYLLTIVMYLRGTFGLLNDKLNHITISYRKLLTALALITIATFLFARKTITSDFLNFFILIILSLCSLGLIYLGLKKDSYTESS